MAFGETIKSTYNFILDLLFPIQCLVCGKDEVLICDKCLNNIPRLPKQACLICKLPSPFGATHPVCKTKHALDGIISALPYQEKHVKEMIKAFKFKYISSLAEPLAQIIFKEIQNNELTDFFKDFIIVPVPLHPKRLRWRGFNQAEILGNALVKILGNSTDINLIKREKTTIPQTKLTQEERQKNIQNAFTITENANLAGKKILLIDDVVTSGATLRELARIIKKSGADSVWAVTLAKD